MSQYEQMQRFNAASPRPKLRKSSPARPGGPVPPCAVLWVTEDRERGLALIRGKNVGAILDDAGAREAARWSVGAKGFVVPSSLLADVLAMADYRNAPWRIKQVQADG